MTNYLSFIIVTIELFHFTPINDEIIRSSLITCSLQEIILSWALKQNESHQSSVV